MVNWQNTPSIPPGPGPHPMPYVLHETLHLELEIGATPCSVVVLEILQDSSGVKLLGTLACGLDLIIRYRSK